MPVSLISNSIHIFDLVYFLCNGFAPPLFQNFNEKAILIFTKSKNVEQLIFNINFDSIENFQLNFI